MGIQLMYFRRKKPFIWFYFNVGTYEIHWKRCVLDFYIGWNKTYGFSLTIFEREI